MAELTDRHECCGAAPRCTWSHSATLARSLGWHALARRKPVMAVFSGRSVAGKRAGASHTAAAASLGVAVDTLFDQAGVIRADHLGELLDVARMVTDQPLPARRTGWRSSATPVVSPCWRPTRPSGLAFAFRSRASSC